MTNGRIVFFGTSSICSRFLTSLRSSYSIPLVVCTPDSMGGRQHRPIIPPVKTLATRGKIPLIQPSTLYSRRVRTRLGAATPDLGVVIAYGKRIPDSVIRLFPHGIINVHFSLLPLYRGAAPVQRAIQQGETVTGITIFEIVRQIDAGDIYRQLEVPIGKNDTTPDLLNRMCRIGPDFLLQTVEGILSGSLTKRPQDHDRATCAPPICKEEGRINWDLESSAIYNQFRAFISWPALTCRVKENRFKLTRILPSNQHSDQPPGTILGWDGKALLVCCGKQSVLKILEFQPPNKKPMPPLDYSRGNPLPPRLD